MSDPRKQRFAPYLRDLADRMGLRDWSLTIGDGPPRSGAEASVYMPYAIRHGKVYLSEEFLDKPADEQRATLAHELLHLHFAAMDGIVRDGLPKDLHSAYDRIWEYAVDAIAEGWAKTLPLPPEAE